jgi:26S proteasome regulatory subunit T1
VKESDTGLASPNLWDLAADRQRMAEEHPLQVARCTKIIPVNPDAAEAARSVNPLGAMQGQKGADEQDKYVINIKQIAKFVVGLGERVAPTDIEEGMRVGYVPIYVHVRLDSRSVGWIETNIRFKSPFRLK